MSKKRGAAGPYSYDDDDDYVPTKPVKYSKLDEQPGPAKKKAHTLDSDEEDDVDGALAGEGSAAAGTSDAQNTLKEDDIEGQEDKTLEYEGETTITPFNMKDEMEDGHFDGDGFYHFKKDSDMVKDAWLEDIDWIKVKRSLDNKDKYGSDNEEEDSDSDGDVIMDGVRQEREKEEVLEVYKEIHKLLQPEETVTKALKRLGPGGRKLTSIQKWKLRKQSEGKGQKAEKSSQELENMSSMLKLTELASKVMEAGNMDVYEETYEMIAVKLKPPKSASPNMDMFSDESALNNESATDKKNENGNGDEKSGIDEIRWHMKWENTDGAEVLGPFPSSQMIKWQETGYLDKGAYVKKISDDRPIWYHTKRIDFELYT